MTRWLPILMVACSNPTGEVCDDHAPTETRTVEIGNLDRSVPLGTDFPFFPYEEGQVVLKEFGSQAATHLPVYLRVPADPADGSELRCVWVEYTRGDFVKDFELELERRGDFWVTRLGVQDVAALGSVLVDVRLVDAVFEGDAAISLEAVEPVEL